MPLPVGCPKSAFRPPIHTFRRIPMDARADKGQTTDWESFTWTFRGEVDRLLGHQGPYFITGGSRSVASGCSKFES